MDTTNVYASLVSEDTRHTYSIEWLDLLITVFLNPDRTDIASITNEQFENLHNLLIEEDTKLQITIKSQVFALYNESKIELLIRRYHSALINLVDQSWENQRSAPAKKNALKNLNKAVLSCLNGLLSFIEIHFPKYLTRRQRVPATYIAKSKKELRQRVDKLKNKIQEHPQLQPMSAIIFKRLYRYTDGTDLQYEVTYKTIHYKQELIKHLEEINWKESEENLYTKVNEVLIYLNFNSKAYINYFTGTLKKEVDESENDLEKMDKLLFCFKAFNQTHRKPGYILNPNNHELNYVISNWFLQEIGYMEKKIHLSALPLSEEKEANQKKALSKKALKVMCALSSDQIGLILRAADELRVLIAKSMNEVFRTLVPHLSTPYRTDLSFEGMRTQSYVAEDTDKQKAIETLERMIKKIREY